MQYELHDIAGNLGVLTIVGTYLALQLRKLPSDSLAYSVLNAVGSALIMGSLIFDFNLSGFAIELFWFLISLFGVLLYFMRRREREG